jgi:hypothetical protein
VAEGTLHRLVHDLFGSLTVIRGVCATLARDEPRDERRAGLALIDAETLCPAAGARRPRVRWVALAAFQSISSPGERQYRHRSSRGRGHISGTSLRACPPVTLCHALEQLKQAVSGEKRVPEIGQLVLS